MNRANRPRISRIAGSSYASRAMTRAGDGSTLSLDFTTGVLDPRVTFTRATGSGIVGGPTYVGSNGYIQYASTNEPRFDYDPTTRLPRGLLLEGAANNLAPYSNGSTSGWVIGGNRTPTNDTTDLVSPDNTNNATKLVCGTAGLYASYAQPITGLTGGATYTISYWIRGPVGHTPRLYATSGTVGDVTPTSTTGTYNNTGWTRLTQTYTLPAGTTSVFVYFLSCTIGGTGDTFYVFGFQMEAGTGASSLIPTGASTANRALDSCYMAGTNFTSWFRDGAGTVVAHSDNVCLPTTTSQNLVGNFSDSTSANYIRMGYRVGGGSTEILLTSVSTSIQGSADSGYTPALNTPYKTGYAWDTNSFACCANGGTIGTDGSGSLAGAGVITSLTIGGDFYQTSGPNSIYMKNGHIRSFKYWPFRLTNAQLQSFTT